jgi:hypothetical protein
MRDILRTAGGAQKTGLRPKRRSRNQCCPEYCACRVTGGVLSGPSVERTPQMSQYSLPSDVWLASAESRKMLSWKHSFPTNHRRAAIAQESSDLQFGLGQSGGGETIAQWYRRYLCNKLRSGFELQSGLENSPRTRADVERTGWGSRGRGGTRLLVFSNVLPAESRRRGRTNTKV